MSQENVKTTQVEGKPAPAPKKRSAPSASAQSAATETLPVMLPQIPGMPEMVFVSVNDRDYYIPRGVTINVPLYVYRVLSFKDEVKNTMETYSVQTP